MDKINETLSSYFKNLDMKGGNVEDDDKNRNRRNKTILEVKKASRYKS
jgi:hypothetical protein